MRWGQLLSWTAVGGLLAIGVYGFWGWLQAPREALDSTRPQESASEAQADARSAPRVREAVYLLQPTEPQSQLSSQLVDARWAKKNREAISKLQAREHAAAVALFEECWKAVPQEAVFQANLAEALARLSNEEWEQGSKEKREQSVVHMRRAKELAPKREDIAQRLEQMERLQASEAGHWTESLEHYELSFDGERTDLLWDSLALPPLLESIYGEYGELFDTWPVERGREKIRVVLYGREGFHQATGMGHWAGGVFDGAVRLPVADLKSNKAEIERVLRHEIAHAFVAFAGGPKVPGWLNEGLAQWLEARDLVGRGQRVAAARQQLGEGPKIELARLEGSLAELGEVSTIQRAYAQSLVLVDKLERDYGERVLFQMVQGYASGQTATATFRARTGVELSSVLDEL